MALRQVSLDDKYEGRDGKVYITGTQSLVRAAMMQHLRDAADSLKTRCFISGYRSSPMHNLDKELWAGKRFLPRFDINFLPAINEDLAATAIWGTQRTGMSGDGNYDDVFSIWYVKGPGIDRSIDAIRHAHQAGSAKHGGVLCVVGDDHVPTSTDSPAAHETLFADLLMPVLYSANVQEIVDFALCGWSGERRMERKLAADYIKHMTEVAKGLSHDNHALTVKLAGVPERIRGYAHVKERYLLQAEADRNALLNTWRRPSNAAPAAA